jgi:L-ascorbate peroxidase
MISKISTALLALTFLFPTLSIAFVHNSFSKVNTLQKNPKLNMVASKEEYQTLQADLKFLLDKTNCAPIIVRLAWHDSGTYDKNIPISEWPKCGGANASIRFEPEINHGANAGLVEALRLLKAVKAKYENISWSDVIQMASATAIESCGGPVIDMKYGRVDAESPEQCSPEGNLPGAAKPFADGSETPQDHLRKVFYRMGFNDREIVALSGAHTLGRAYPERSGFGKSSTKYTDGSSVARADGKTGIGRKGGQSWTEKWLKFDNSYFAVVPDNDEDLLKLETDSSLYIDPSMQPIALEYKYNQDVFFNDYASAHKKLSELGCKWEPAEGITI